MVTTYRLNADELDDRFVESLKAAFRHKEIEITVGEVDETAYLLRSPANREHLLRAVEDLAAGQNIVVPDQQMFQ